MFYNFVDVLYNILFIFTFSKFPNWTFCRLGGKYRNNLTFLSGWEGLRWGGLGDKVQ